MPYGIRKLSKPSRNTKNEMCEYEVYNKDTGESKGKVPTRGRAGKLLAALYANESK